jgi:hypothetical protein
MQKILLPIFFLFSSHFIFGATISGEILSAKDQKPLPFASVLVKGTTVGVSANAQGKFSIQLEPGEYILVCQNVGYASQEKKIRVSKNNSVINFELEPRQYDLKDVVVKSGGEDPAYAIIRKAIEKRDEHLKENQKFTCEVYIKGQLQLRDYPKKFLGQKVDFEDGDSSKRKMIFLSETVARYSRESVDKQKIEVLSTKVSGSSDGFGFSSPQIISFYRNILDFPRSLNPRGFISPLSDNALAYYKYKFEGTFFEFGKEISRIKVIPKRKFEPLFSGYINIVENEWRLESVDLKIFKEQQMQLLDTLSIRQQYVPAGEGWVIKNQVIYPAGKFFSFDFFGSFVQVYDKFNLSPAFAKKEFNNTILKYYDSSNKKPLAYWDSIRPLPLSPEEIKDYKKKDSLEKARKDPHYLDSLDKKRNKLTIAGLLLTGQSISNQKRKIYINFDPIIQTLNYNTVEGAVVQFSPTIRKEFEGRKNLSITPRIRWGITNQHVNPSVDVGYTFGKKYIQSLSVSGGRRVFQFNNADPISERINSLYTLYSQENFMKIYEADYLKLEYSTGIGNGLNVSTNFQFQNRSPLANLSDVVYWGKDKGRSITPNYPAEITSAPMASNKASLLTVGISWRPGGKYIEYPDRKVAIGSRYPTLSASITQGINGLLGSSSDFTKWRFSVTDELNLKLFGRVNYRFNMGGFLNANAVSLPDYQHFLGNQTIFSSEFTNSFQLAGYYELSNTSIFYSTFNMEYHLNGFLTNKIPGFKKLNWFLVTGINTIGINQGKNYNEYFIGLENILKIIRVDFVQSFNGNINGSRNGVRISLPLIR